MKPMPSLVAALVAALVCQLAGPLEAGAAMLRVRFSLDRPTYLLYESVPARVIIENFSGQTIHVGTGPGATHQLSFLITDYEGLAVPKVAAPPVIEPLEIPHGREGDIAVDLVRMYSIRTPGLYRVLAVIGERGQPVYAQSATVTIDVVRGRTVWSQRVGVPRRDPDDPDEKPERRFYELLVNRVGPHDELFLRIQDEDRRLIHGVHPLGAYLPFKKPEIRFDGVGYLHVMQQSTPRTYTYSVFSPYGDRQTRGFYSDMVTIPHIQSDGRGNVMVIGGEEIGPDAPTDPDFRPGAERDLPPEDAPATEPDQAPPAETAKPPAEAAKPPAEAAKPTADTAKPTAEAAKPTAETAGEGEVDEAVPDPEVRVPPADRKPIPELMPRPTTDADAADRPGPGDRVVPR